MEDELIEARDSFFDKEDRGKFQHTLRKMEEYYPICYKLFADIFFEGKSVDELASGRHEKAVKRFLKKLLIIGIIVLIIALIGFVVWFVNDRKEKQYEGPYIYLVYSSMGFSFELGSHTSYSNCLTEDDMGLSEEEMVSGEWSVYPEDLYEIFRNNDTFEQVKNKYRIGILTEVDNYLLEYYGYVGAYRGYFSYCAGCPVYGIGDKYSEYEHFSWSSETGTWCSNEYLCEKWGLTYVDSGYSALNGALVTIYDWNEKLVVIVLQAEGSHTLIQFLPMANYPINYW